MSEEQMISEEIQEEVVEETTDFEEAEETKEAEEVKEEKSEAELEMVEPPKRKRGRPRKNPVEASAKEAVKEEGQEAAPAPKRRGRPRKSEQVAAPAAEPVKETRRPVRTGGKVSTTFSLTAGKETKSVEDFVAMVESTYAGKINTLDITLDINTQRINAKINGTIDLSFPV